MALVLLGVVFASNFMRGFTAAPASKAPVLSNLSLLDLKASAVDVAYDAIARNTEAYTGKNKPWKLQATGISHNCTELNLLHHAAYARVQKIDARAMKQHLCGEHFDPFIAVRDGIRCPVNVEFACDRIVLTEFGSTFSWKDPVKTWHLR